MIIAATSVVILSKILSYDIHNVELSISVNTGVLFDKITELPVATKVSVGTNIFLFFIPKDFIDKFFSVYIIKYKVKVPI